MAMLKDLLEDTRTTALSEKIEKEAPGLLSEADRIKVASLFLGKKILSKNVHVRVIADPIAFGEAVTLEDSLLAHSWAGDRRTLEEGTWLVGEGTFGKFHWRQHSDNGDCSVPKEKLEDPDFDMECLQVVYKKEYHLDSFRSPGEEWTHHFLLIFQPRDR